MRPLACFISHKGVWEYEKEGHCDQSHTCQRCEVIRTRFRHSAEWQYRVPYRCLQIRTCLRCNIRRVPTLFRAYGERVKHDWTKWESTGRWSYTSTRICRRCGETDSRTHSGSSTYG